LASKSGALLLGSWNAENGIYLHIYLHLYLFIFVIISIFTFIFRYEQNGFSDYLYYCIPLFLTAPSPITGEPTCAGFFQGVECYGLVWNTQLLPGQWTRVGQGYWFLFWQIFLVVVQGGILQTVGELLNTRLRKNVSAEFHRLLLGEKRLYKLSVPSGYGDDIDNHDQRISEDLQRTLDDGIGIIFGNYIVQPALFLTVYRSIISLERAYNRIFDYERDGVNLGFILTTIGLAVTSFGIYIMTMNMISVVLFNQKKYEGNLRWSHARVLNFVEPVCLYGGEFQEGAQADDRFSECYSNYKYVALLQSTLAGNPNPNLNLTPCP
jgi:ABC-type uncharacterized transport system fused permease/ATPase subunit